MPGILHFIQHEWSRFEMERAQWDVERAELQVIKSIAVMSIPFPRRLTNVPSNFLANLLVPQIFENNIAQSSIKYLTVL